MKTNYVYNEHNVEVRRSLPRLVLDISLLFVLVQTGLALLNMGGHFILAHFKH